MTQPKISIIVPAFNEEKYIESTIQAIRKWTYDKEIIIVDDGSTDKTKEILMKIASDSVVKPIFLKLNQGKGQALKAGVKQAEGEVIMFLDADLGDSAKDADRLLDPIFKNDADMTIAILPRSSMKAGFGLVKKLARSGIYFMTGYQPIAPLSGQRAMKRKVIDQITELVSGFGIEVGLTIDVLRMGFKIKEVEVALYHRETGRDLKGFIHRGKEFIAVAKALFIKWRQQR
ncbi:MAG: glycosyltransferase family 2 protein [Tepidibacillus sp.]|uniref:glycosyltransferase family 2 protein n=1 Tax=Tepidibacillus sp. HK-1 TaxID=1883407 RepID=UPI000853AD4E|nr:glycosyltransferase family 2 protein [Tepidibacillus sp. HK-1]GBF11053.1 poly-beta-1,6-N-acetyl-D-glucosamine synthase [Tepidibacillus sp. HK-1]